MLQLQNIHKTFNIGTVNEKKALTGIDLTINDGDFITVIGGNGAGKSTMLNIIAGVFPPEEGNIIIDGVEVKKKSVKKNKKEAVEKDDSQVDEIQQAAETTSLDITKMPEY